MDGLTLLREVLEPDIDGDGSTSQIRYKLRTDNDEEFMRTTLTDD